MEIKVTLTEQEFETIWTALMVYKDASKYLCGSYQQITIEDVVNPLMGMLDYSYMEEKRRLHDGREN